MTDSGQPDGPLPQIDRDNRAVARVIPGIPTSKCRPSLEKWATAGVTVVTGGAAAISGAAAYLAAVE